MLSHLMTALDMSYNSRKKDYLKKLDIPRHPSSIIIPNKPKLNFKDFKQKYEKKTGIEKENDRLIEEEIDKEYKKHLEKVEKNWEEIRNENKKIRFVDFFKLHFRI